MSNQAATNATSAMTRNLALAEELFNVGFWAFGQNSAGGNAGAGSSQARSGSTAGGWGRALITSTAMRSGASGGITLRCDVPIAVSVFGSLDVNGAAGNGAVVRVIVGDPGLNGATPPAFANFNALSARGFGAEFYYSTANARQEVRLFAFDTSYAVSAGVAFPNAYQGTHTVVVSSDALGNIKLFGHTTGGLFAAPQRPVLLATMTGGPQGANNMGGSNVTVVCVNHSTVAPSSGDVLFTLVRTKTVINAIV
jgi:hypothetical protein